MAAAFISAYFLYLVAGKFTVPEIHQQQAHAHDRQQIPGEPQAVKAFLMSSVEKVGENFCATMAWIRVISSPLVGSSRMVVSTGLLIL